MKTKELTISILGCGNLGRSITEGLLKSKQFSAKYIFATRRDITNINDLSQKGIRITKDNKEAVKNSELVIIAVTPQQLNDLCDDIKEVIDQKKHKVISVVSGASIEQIKSLLGEKLSVVRVMPNTAIAIQESMSCISGEDKKSIKLAENIFNYLGKTIVISEDLMVPATALCACGTAFFMRAIRAASQGGIEIGFHAEDALFMAAQTAKGAAAMIIEEGNHPEHEVDKVTTPQGCTISGLNQMEHHGFSSSLIKGITTSAQKAETLYSK